MMFSSWKVKFESDEVIDRFLDNVDVWQAIFEMLSVKDRIRLEMTNKRLRILMFEYWKRVTSFDTKCLTEMSHNPSMSKKGKKNRKKLSTALFAICVNRIGDGLRSLTIRERSTSPVGSWTDNLPSIGEGCPNVETINFIFDYKYMHRNGTLDIHFDSFSRLKTLTVSPAGAYIISASASVFLSIPTSIEVIRGLYGTWAKRFENVAQIEGFFAHRPSLREVCLGNLFTDCSRKADMFRVIAQRCPHLKSIKLSQNFYNCIDYNGVIALESMKQLRIHDVMLDEMQIVTICERSPFVEAIELKLPFSSNPQLQSTALNALGSLTKLVYLHFSTEYGPVPAPSLVTEFVRKLARNSGASLRRLEFGDMSLSTEAIETLANGCPKLRYLYFRVRVGEVEPASIRFLIDSIVAHPSWIHQTDQPTLAIYIHVIDDDEDEVDAGRAAFEALAAPAANLPSGVKLIIY